MNWWQVAGLDRNLGVARTLTLRAATFDDACERAAEHEIVVYVDQVHSLDAGADGERRALGNLIELTRKRRIVRLSYVKLGEVTNTVRLVEVYHLLQASTGMLVHCAQVNPPTSDTPWRNFRLDRVLAVEDGGAEFSARIPISIEHGEIRDFWEVKQEVEAREGARGADVVIRVSAGPPASALSPADAYAQAFVPCLGDSKLQANEKRELTEMAAKLKKSQVKVAHARVLAHLLEDLASDDDLNAADTRLLKRVMSVMHEIGWAPLVG